MHGRVEADRKMWFSMWFLVSIASFGIGFFLMFYRLIEGRNRHFRREAELKKRIATFLKKQGKEPPATQNGLGDMNAKAWAVAIILVIPVFAITYFLSKDLLIHEKRQYVLQGTVFPERLCMQQTIPIKKYVLIAIVTLGVGIVYWLYKIVNMYNIHFKVQSEIEKEISRLMENERVGKSM
jgi:hypothetical protein